jgi:DNA-binding LacI/PurR family transcriptional regulator
MSKVTIEDISRHTGLSRGTVSRALNDRPDISQATKQRVLESCRELNYVPSHAARSLATGRRYAVAVLVDDLRTGFSTAFLRGVLARAQDARYAVHVADRTGLDDAGLMHLSSLLNERVDALLATAVMDDGRWQSLREPLGQRPLVTTTALGNIGCDVLSPDNTESGRLVARHILRAGRGAVYVHATGNAAFDLRRQGFEEVCRESGMNPGEMIVEVGPRGTPNRLAGMSDRISSAAAIAASDDFLATEIMMRCYHSGRTPGRDVAVMGQGNECVGEAIEPGLATVDLHGEEIGGRAMEIALQRITGARQDAAQQTLVAPSVVARASIANLG